MVFDAWRVYTYFRRTPFRMVVFDQKHGFSTMRLELAPIPILQEKTVPDGAKPAGWAALVQSFAIRAPVRRPSSVSDKHISGSQRQDGDWVVFDKRYWPGETFADHLTFALRREGIDLLILKRVF